MDNHLITKIINTNDVNTCSEFAYEIPLIDRNVAGALARSFVKILRVSQQDSKINNNVRNSVFANIRQICRIEPDNHLEIDENFTKSLTKVYMTSMRSPPTNEITNSIERTLDDFLIRKMKDVDLNSHHQCTMKPEVIQALMNLNESNSYPESIAQNILHWNRTDKKNLALIKNLWTNTSLDNCVRTTILCDDMSIVMRSEIESCLLNICHRLLTEPDLKTEDVFLDITLLDLVKKCVSSECFQICSRILNYLFINTNYNMDIQVFISKFVKNVSMNCSNCIATLYPANLSSIVILLDVDLETLPNIFKSKYVERTLVHLKRLHEKSDVTLLLSHFPQWFSLYVDMTD